MREAIQAARGARPADLLLRNVQLVNVFTGKTQSVDLAVEGGRIAGWGGYEAKEEIDGGGAYVCPAFIDGHLHIESTLLGPEEFCAAVVPRGTGAVVADPHELANVLGLDGIRWFLDATQGLPLDCYFNLPSCVPSSPLETSGAVLEAADLETFASHPRVPGLAEMMNFPGVLEGFPDVLDKLLAFRGRVRDGHAPLLSGLDLNGYLAAGIGSDHECTNLDEAREKISKGMTIMIREGSQSRDMEALLSVVDDRTWPFCMLVSDDRHPDDLLRRGHMNVNVNRAMELGLDPVRAITLATLTPARYFSFRDRGALAPGYRADFSLSPTLNPWVPERVFRTGTEVARGGGLIGGAKSSAQPVPSPGSPMKMAPPDTEQLVVPRSPGKVRVIGIREGSLLTAKLLLEPAERDGLAVADPKRDLVKIAVFNRYREGRRPAVGFVQGLGLSRGAVGSTVAHDSHNMIVAGVEDEDIAAVAEALRRAGGGMAAGEANGTMKVLKLPLGGLMSDLPLREVVEELDELKSLARQWGSALDNPFMALSFLALPVIPELKLTDLGLVDVGRFEVVDLFEM
jgi:adenine deaminase